MRNAEIIESNQQEEHIVSAVIHVRPTELEALLAEIDQHPNLESAAWDETGKLVLLVTTNSQRMAALYIEQLQLRPGVLGATLVAHHFETASELDQPAESFEQVPNESLPQNSLRSAL